VKLINEKWTDLNGRKHKLYTVRSAGNGQGLVTADGKAHVGTDSVN
jgi:hypothetical protein